MTLAAVSEGLLLAHSNLSPAAAPGQKRTFTSLGLYAWGLRKLGRFTGLLEALFSEIGFYIFTFPIALVAFSNSLQHCCYHRMRVLNSPRLITEVRC